MFVHQNQLEYLLKAEQYYSKEQHEKEMEKLFLPSWHLVGSTADLPKNGDFRTFDFLGTPIQLRNYNGKIHAFLNVCSHRHAILTNISSGNSDCIRCQYHGWEYAEDGKTRKIPDAGCFRPFDRDRAQLTKFRIETCGELLFLTLAHTGPSLREFLGEHFDDIQKNYSDPYRLCWSWEFDYKCNWKVGIENTVESYHLPCLHKATFTGIYPSEERQQHLLDERFSKMIYDTTEDPKVTFWQRWVVKQLGGVSKDLYTHLLIHPNLVFTTSDVLMHSHAYFPTSPTTSKGIVRLYALKNIKPGFLKSLFAKSVAWNGKRMDKMVQMEDVSIFETQQKGIEATRHVGIIGTREERIYVFQKFVQDRLNGQHK